MKNLRISFVLILLVGMMGLLTACGGDTATATVATTPPTATTGTTEALPTATMAMAADTPTTAMVADTPTTVMAADTPTTEAMAADTPTTAAMAADTPTTGTGSGTGITDPTLLAAMEAMKSVKSYHTSMTTETAAMGAQTIEIDNVPPDKMSMTTKMAAAGQTIETKTIIIGQDVWTNMAGQWTKTSMGANPMANPSDFASMGQVSDVQDLGDDTIDGIATKHLSYKSTMADPTGAGTSIAGTAEIWVDKATHYIVQLKSTSDIAGTTATVTIKYSRFNDPSITIEPPQ